MTMENTCDIIVGLQHGDEGKGKVAYSLLKHNEYDYCIRYNGGPNAGHTIHLTQEKSVILHQLPCGVLTKVPSIIGTNCVVDIFKLEAEIKEIEERIPELKGIKERLYLAHNAHLILDVHIEADRKQGETLGTTKCGIGPCYVDKVNRTGTRVMDYEDIVSKLKFNIINTYEYFCKERRNNNLLFEGAQGHQLDIDWGDYPYVTSSVVNSYGIFSCGIPNIRIKDIIGCAKIYDTYVGAKPFQPQENKMLQLIASYGNEKGATTGRQRQTNWINMEALERAICINNCNYVVINKCDILKQIKMVYKDECVFKVVINKDKEVKEFSDMEAMMEYIYYRVKQMEMMKHKNMNIIFSESQYGI